MDILDMVPLAVLAAFLVLSFLAISGWGSAFSNAVGLPARQYGFANNFWLGYLFTLAAVEFINLWFPIDWRISLVFYAGGIFLCLIYQSPLWSRIVNIFLQAFRQSVSRQLATAACLFFLVLACLWAMALPINEDSWGYHFQSIRWINEYPIVPGLGNLHGRFAFNQSHFGFLAILNFFPYWNKAYAAGGLLLLLASALTVASIMQRDLPGKRFLVILLLVVLEPMARYSASPSPDFAVSLLQVVGAVYFLFILYPEPAVLRQRHADFSVLLCVCAALATVKLSGLILAVVMGGVALWFNRGLPAGSKKTLYRVGLVIVFFGLVHLSRGLITSGVPLYPSTLGSQWRFDWSMPIERMQNEAGWIISCARAGSPCQDPSRMQDGWAWVDFWWAHLVPDNAKALFFFSITATLCTAWVNSLGNASSRSAVLRDGLLRDWYLLIPFFGAMVFWLFSAPDVRFLGRMLELMFALSMWTLLCSWDRYRAGTSHRWSPWFSNRFGSFQSFNFSLLLFLTVLIFCFRLLPVPGFSWPVLPEPAINMSQSENGVSVNVPSDGSCWFSKLPCTPAVDSRLEYREPASENPLAHGFRLHQSP